MNDEEEEENLTLWEAIKTDPKHSSIFLIGFFILLWIMFR